MQVHHSRYFAPDTVLIARLAGGVIIAVAVVATLLALLLFRAEGAGIAALVLFALLLFVGGPMWLAMIEDTLEHEHERQAHPPGEHEDEA